MKSKSCSLLLVLLGVGVAGYFFAGRVLGGIAVRAVNRYGPDLTGTTVTLGSASLSPVTGRGWMKDLTVGNPEGFVALKAFSVGRLEVAVQPLSLLRDTVVIDEIVIEQPEFFFEAKLTTSNLEEIVEHVKTHQPGGEAAPKPYAATPPEKSGGKRLILHHLILENTHVKLTLAGVALATTIPHLELHEIGTAQGGVTPAEAVSEVLPQVIEAVLEAGARTTATQGLKERAKELGRQLKAAAREILRK